MTRKDVRKGYAELRKELLEARVKREQTIAAIGPERTLEENKEHGRIVVDHHLRITNIEIKSLGDLSVARKILREAFGTWNDRLLGAPYLYNTHASLSYCNDEHKGVYIDAFVPLEELWTYGLLSDGCKVVERTREVTEKVIECERVPEPAA